MFQINDKVIVPHSCDNRSQDKTGLVIGLRPFKRVFYYAEEMVRVRFENFEGWYWDWQLRKIEE